MQVFIKYWKDKDSIIKIVPNGLLKNIFNSSSLKTFFNSEYSDYKYYLIDLFISNGKINILILPNDQKRYTDFIIVDTYSNDGDFLYETYYLYEDYDKIHLSYIFSDKEKSEAYLLIKSKKRNWQIVKFE